MISDNGLTALGQAISHENKKLTEILLHYEAEMFT